MKSRQKLSVSEKSLLRRYPTEADNYLEIRTYNNLLRKPSYGHIGDADRYFKQSLRNEPFDLIRDLNLTDLVRSTKSFESICQSFDRRRRSKRTLVHPNKVSDVVPKSVLKTQIVEEEEFRLKEVFSPDLKTTSDSDSDSVDNDYFFSPEKIHSPKTEYLEKVDETEEKASVSEPVEESKVQESSEAEEETPRPDIDKISVRLDNILKEVQDEEEKEVNDMGEEYDETEFGGGEEFGGFADDDDDEMKEVETMIERASAELAQVAEENKKIMETLTEGDEGGEEEGEGDAEKEEFKYNPAVDSVVLKELEDAEFQAKQTAKIITELKLRVMELSKKEKMTEAEAKELEQKNMELKRQMIIFEKKTKIIQDLLAQSNLFENLGAFKPSRYNEDILPKVVVCGLTENQMPKILICDDNKTKSKHKKKRPKSPRPSSAPCTCETTDQRPQIAMLSQRQDTCDCRDVDELIQPMSPQIPLQMMQQMSPQMKQQIRPQFMQQRNFTSQQDTCECHEPQPEGQMGEPPMGSPMMPPMGPQMMPPMMSQIMPPMMNLMGQQDTCKCHEPQPERRTGEAPMGSPMMALIPPQMMPPIVGPPPMEADYCECDADAFSRYTPRPTTRSGRSQSAMPCGKGRGICPAEIESRLQEYSENTQFLEKQLYDMEAEVKEMHHELIAVQKEREHLEHHRKMLCSPPPCDRPPCPAAAPCPPPCFSLPSQPQPCETQLRELREQYKRLQDDFKGKLTEVAGLRTENEKLKDKTRQAEDAKKEAEKQVRDLEIEIKRIKGTLKIPKQVSKEQVIELEQQLSVAKQRFREAQDELDELRLLVEDQQQQLDDYRNKYLEAQQQVEEQRRQIDLMEMENQRISEQVNLEIQRVKNQFQEKLQELMPLPDILKSTQMKLQEAQQMHLLAERNNESIARELQMYKDKIAAMTNQIDEVRSDQQFGEDAKASLESKVKELEAQLNELQELNANLLADLEKFTEKCDEYEKLADERLHEIVQLEAQLECLREETARQVARIKDRCEIVRRSMQKQISDLERQLAQSRALAKSAQKDRDDIRQKMQAQINNLNENFEDAQMRIRNLQGHVNFLRNSYGDVYSGDNNKIVACRPPAPPDPCDCNPDY